MSEDNFILLLFLLITVVSFWGFFEQEKKIKSLSPVNFYDKKIIRTEHHGFYVYAFESQVGKHLRHCLCGRCERIFEDPKCKIASELYAFCKKHHTVTPVFECPNFVEDKDVVK